MAPEYGATMGFFPVDAGDAGVPATSPTATADLVALVEAYTKEQGLFRTDATPDPLYSDTLELDLADGHALDGRARSGRRIAWSCPTCGRTSTTRFRGRRRQRTAEIDGADAAIEDGAVVIAAITSCTNTSNPSVMLAAGLLAKKAVERGLTSEAVGEDQPRARLEGGDGLLPTRPG